VSERTAANLPPQGTPRLNKSSEGLRQEADAALSPGGPLSVLDARVIATPAVAVSIVVPGLNESASLPELARRIELALGATETYELIFVDDGSTDNTWEVISALHAQTPKVRGLRLRRNFGKAMALAAGFAECRGDILVMMDADLQDDPVDLPLLITKVRSELDVVVGWKVSRKDPLSRRLFSKVFNGTVRYFTGVHLHDMNCGFKAYRREVIETIPIYGDLFRFIPVLAAAEGFNVDEVPVTHHPRAFGRSRYGLERILRGFFDLLTVIFLTRYVRKPMHLFGLLGLATGSVGLLIALYLTVGWFLGSWIGSRPLLQLSVMMMVTGAQLTALGFIGEFLTYQNQKRSYRDHYPIRERV
jgi:glycosyltransferase involved in cell wall biosynthesis